MTHGESKKYVIVDCVVFGFDGRKFNLLMTSNATGKTWRLISGFVTTTQSADETAQRIIGDATGLNNTKPEQIFSFTRFCEDSDEAVISIAYYVVIPTKEVVGRPVTNNLNWFTRNDIMNSQPNLRKVIECAFQKLQQRAFSNSPSLGLLPEKFTWKQLHKLYEAIAEKPVDSRNLRKKINTLKIVVRLNQKEKSGSKKGSYLYSYNREYHSPVRLTTRPSTTGNKFHPYQLNISTVL